MGRLPNFLIIGAQKAGTSWLHQKLRLHPEIFLPPVKDQAHFYWDEGPHASTLEQYSTGFDPALECQAVGEATAAYFWTGSGSQWDVKPRGHCANVPKRVLDTLGRDTRLILSLRDPVDRAVSAYLHHIANGDLDPGVSLLDTGDFVGLIDMGFYAAHLQNWLRYFPLRQIHVLIYERDVVQHARDTLPRVFDFLDVDSGFHVQEPEQIVFLGRQRVWSDGEVWVPPDEYPTVPGQQQRQIDGYRYCRYVDRPTVNKLREIYAPDRVQLQGILGIDLDPFWT